MNFDVIKGILIGAVAIALVAMIHPTWFIQAPHKLGAFVSKMLGKAAKKV